MANYNSVQDCKKYIIETEKARLIDLYLDFPEEREYIESMAKSYESFYEGNFEKYIIQMNNVLQYKHFNCLEKIITEEQK